MDLCHICQINTNNFTYPCCHQKSCEKCTHEWYSHNTSCPFCRKLVVINLTDSQLVDKFKSWIISQNIDIEKLPYNYVKTLRNIDNIFSKNDQEITNLQVANTNKIHVFKYKNINEVNFKYHEKYNLVEITGGDYFFYDKLKDSENFGWWLHSFVGETN